MGDVEKVIQLFIEENLCEKSDLYEKALDYQSSSQSPNYLWLSNAYENIGYAREKLGQTQLALKYYEKQRLLLRIIIKSHWKTMKKL
ncbi:unnamed protein product [Adineta ricciae]|uniref:Uncharacterized protein n=1 Tax=Adineta ricciae TaxID=249248 RepID=A0A815BZG1_ADIRI|nr:unnamed protein product [Adineta ricciae]CAF1277005.1 unnamed protein product [Adineta ricciae]